MKNTKKKTKPHLSPSSITQYLKCSAQFMFRKLIGNKPPSIALLYGKSVDEAINVDMEQKILTRKNLPMDDIKDAFVTEWDENKDDTEFHSNDKPDALREIGINSVGHWSDTVAQDIQPKFVQKKLAVEFDDFDFDILQFADVITEDDVIIDNKTAGRSVSKNKKSGRLVIPHDHRLQLTMYDLGYEVNESTKAKSLGLDYLIKTKTPKVQQSRWMPNQQDRQYVLGLMEHVANGVKKEVFIPNRNNMMCSKRFCAYWQECEKKYGGRVKP
tara:strand:+ start:1884 stop:2696 length:813 start_codon:yes stop_codon:yes gene_type:complete